MDQRAVELLFALLRSALGATATAEAEREGISSETVQALLKMAASHDVDHLLLLGLKKSGALPRECAGEEKRILKAIYRHEQLQYEYERLCEALEKAEIPFLPLKGAVIRGLYPEPWMRTSCDIDVLVHREDLERAILQLSEQLKYAEKERATHDVSLFSPSGVHVELHFDLVEEGRANNAIRILNTVWEKASLRENSSFWYEMTDEMFYFYHVAHMAKHFESGGCGIRPFLDLYLLDQTEGAKAKRDELLAQGNLLKFTETARALSASWFGGAELDPLAEQMQDFVLHGGAYGSSENRVALQQKKKGGQWGYFVSSIDNHPVIKSES